MSEEQKQKAARRAEVARELDRALADAAETAATLKVYVDALLLKDAVRIARLDDVQLCTLASHAALDIRRVADLHGELARG